jgi:hypothetical protein
VCVTGWRICPALCVSHDEGFVLPCVCHRMKDLSCLVCVTWWRICPALCVSQDEGFVLVCVTGWRICPALCVSQDEGFVLPCVCHRMKDLFWLVCVTWWRICPALCVSQDEGFVLPCVCHRMKDLFWLVCVRWWRICPDVCVTWWRICPALCVLHDERFALTCVCRRTKDLPWLVSVAGRRICPDLCANIILYEHVCFMIMTKQSTVLAVFSHKSSGPIYEYMRKSQYLPHGNSTPKSLKKEKELVIDKKSGKRITKYLLESFLLLSYFKDWHFLNYHSTKFSIPYNAYNWRWHIPFCIFFSKTLYARKASAFQTYSV